MGGIVVLLFHLLDLLQRRLLCLHRPDAADETGLLLYKFVLPEGGRHQIFFQDLLLLYHIIPQPSVEDIIQHGIDLNALAGVIHRKDLGL